MPGPFPGMDPYLEDPVLWPGVHLELISSARRILNTLLPSSYVADTRERVYVVQSGASIYPDIPAKEHLTDLARLVRSGGTPRTAPQEAPWIITAPPLAFREPYVEIVDLSLRPYRIAISVVEILSPPIRLIGRKGGRSILESSRRSSGARQT